MNYKEVIESRYNRQKWQELLHDIFGNKADLWATPYEIQTNSDMSKQTFWLGTITLTDGETIAVYEVELSDSVDIERNRRGIRDMLLTEWRNRDAGAFMFCYRKNESVLRFSYVSEAWTFAEDGTYSKESTDTKRFTYLLGEGHRSRTAIQQFEKLRDSKLSLKDLTKAFSVEAVSDMFFNGYKKQYEDIIFYVTGKRMVKVANKWEERQEGQPCDYIMQQFAHFPNPEKAIRDYVKKLMGRLVFLQFLQKKGWLGVPVNAEWGDGDPEFIQNLFAQCQDKDHFVDNVLEELFNDLNSERTNDLVSSAVGSNIRVPYLNGGLFEREATDETEFPLPAKYMQQMLDFFASYNFTIDENDPDDAEVGVDPEMLGRIFENLLEDNKDKGAFYTPKEIVTYMCRESLIAYLQTDIEDEETKEAIRQFVTNHEKNDKLPADTDQKLKDVKICDPAIGSGAFPMGLLKELFLCRTALEGIEQSKAAEIKKHIIQQNIYGVDIERGAVDIARLRFWLSLIVDEETPQALPNLDYKIVEGNSLITTFDGQYIDLEKGKGEARFRPSLINIQRERKKLQEEQKRFFTLSGDEKYRSEIAIKKHILNTIWYQLDYEKHSWQNAIVEQTGLFGAIETQGRKKNVAQVMEFTQERQKVFDKCEALISQINDESKTIRERASISIPFFEWETIFSDIFENDKKKGFDIIIANPPYIRVQNLDYETIDILKKHYKVAFKRLDISLCFIELAHKICKQDYGAICYITSNQFLTTEYGKEMRAFILKERSIKSCVDLADLPVFSDALTYVSIFSFQLNKPSDNFNYYHSNTMDDVRRMQYTNVKAIDFSSLSSDNWNLKGNEKMAIFEKMCKGNLCLEDIGHCNAGLITGCDKIMMFKDSDLVNLPFEKDILLPVLRADNCNKYYATEPSKYVIYPYFNDGGKTKILTEEKLKELYPKAYSYLLKNKDALLSRKDSRKTIGEKSSWFGLVRFGRLDMFEQPKIISPGEVLEHKFCIDYSNSGFSCARVFAITINKEYDIKYVLALLNSRIMRVFIQSIASLKNGGYYQYSANILNRCPIPTPTDNQKSIIINSVDTIIKKKRAGEDTSHNESVIDNIVYHLYGLTYDEVLIVDPETPITREEYEMSSNN